MDTQLTENFHLSEFACKCGCGADHIDKKLVAFLQTIRTLFDKPIKINSGVRCQAWNAHPEVGGKPTSSHLKGLAVDISCQNSSDRHRLLEIVMNGADDLNRIGIAKSFLHLDIDLDKKPRCVWVY